ncbi:MAG TPA: CYTH domain-containing protein [Candidatus Limivivens merdigallinarum]|uniref:CYTH domain-containing protein n=1 Tax=Candidatus Limivivens merdigallinarum TaxID=2840859 RepID=A0A9D0ZXM2_9FIRM|nr:CYTH domain-containing protein [Candidatus Limivivens merdigallinarum]
MEIERKYLVRALPAHLDSYPYHTIEQAYLCTEPVIRIRRQDDSYYLTYKSKGMLSREEYNLPLTKEAFDHLLPKADGTIITKRRYVIPLENGLSAELDLFDGSFQGMVLVEVEFPDEAASRAFTPPSWFAEEVTYRKEYHNSYLSSLKRS